MQHSENDLVQPCANEQVKLLKVVWLVDPLRRFCDETSVDVRWSVV